MPKFEETLKTVFQWMDKTISVTNRDHANAWIWASIDKDERHVIATHLVELGQKSRVVAEAVRKVTAAHRMLQIGIITGPRFLMTYQHYAEHGGLVFPWPQKKAGQQVIETALNPVGTTAAPAAAQGGAK